MPIAIRSEDSGLLEPLPPAPPPPVIQAAPAPPVVQAAPPAPALTIAAGLDPAIATAIAARERAAQAPAPAPAPAPAAAPPGAGDGSPEPHRGLPQPGDLPGDTGPIVAPHGEPSPSAPPASGGGDGGTTTTTTTTTQDTTVEGDRTLASADTGDKTDNRLDAAHAWLRFQLFFAGELPHLADQLTKLRQGLPKVVG